MHFKTIHIALSPNNTRRDTLLALGLLLFPWNWFSWKKGPAVKMLEDRFQDYLGAKYVKAVGSGREALLMILEGLDLPKDAEVIIQSFTCMVVVNSILWSGCKPVYADIDEHYNLTAGEVEKKITAKTRVVIVQHTFGIPGNLDSLQKLCREKGLILIEDCAHALGALSSGKPVGSRGELSFFSLGRSKVISCVSGGMVVCNNEKYLPGLKKQEKLLKSTPAGQIFQNLLHPPVSTISKALYGLSIGKLILVASQKLKLINLEVTPQEKKSVRPATFVAGLSNAMAKIALVQWSLLEEFNQRRRTAAQYYFDHLRKGKKLDPALLKGAIFLRYPLLIKNPVEVRREARKTGIILGDWYSVPVAPADIDKIKSGYQAGSCKKTENFNTRILNLPTHHSLSAKDLKNITNLVNKYAED
jgi:dTDP-4-amino-4,6-dideoxygalactose transaminase